jgi:hypothetical protein
MPEIIKILHPEIEECTYVLNDNWEYPLCLCVTCKHQLNCPLSHCTLYKELFQKINHIPFQNSMCKSPVEKCTNYQQMIFLP